jgi:hypothetical protein
MLTTPSDPLIVMLPLETEDDPRETLVLGALIARAPAVSVMVAFEASADTANPAANAVSVASMPPITKNLRMIIFDSNSPHERLDVTRWPQHRSARAGERQ